MKKAMSKKRNLDLSAKNYGNSFLQVELLQLPIYMAGKTASWMFVSYHIIVSYNF